MLIFFITGILLILVLLVLSRSSRKGLEEIEGMIRENRLEKAKNLLQKFLRPDRFNPRAHFLLARIYGLVQQYDFAVMELKSVLKHGLYTEKVPRKDVYGLLAEMYLKSGRIEEALQQYRLLEKTDQNDYHALLHLGKILFHQKDYEKALEYFTRASKINPSDPDALAGLGMCSYRQGDLKKTSEILGMAVQQDKRNYTAHYYLALHYHDQNLYDHAITEYEMAAHDKSIRLDALYGMARAYRQKEILTKAVENYEQAVSLMEQTAERIRNYTERMAYLSQSSMLDIRYELAELYMQDKNFAAAMEQWQEIDAIQPEYRDVRQKIKENARYGKDRIQDLLIAKETDFEKIARYMALYLDFTVKKAKLRSKEEILLEAYSNSPDIYSGLWYILVRRSFNPVGEREIAEFYNLMVKDDVKKSILISASGVAPTGIKFILDKPMDLIGKSQVMRLLKKYEQRI